MNLEEIIEATIAAKSGDKEFVLTNNEDGTWEAVIGNSFGLRSVGLGEAMSYGGADFRAIGATPLAAVTALYANVISANEASI